MISFKKYYLQQFKDIPFLWKLAKRHKKYGAFILSVLVLLFPMVIFTMWMYDTEQKDIDERFCKKIKDKETVNPIKTSNSEFDDFFNSDVRLHEMLKTPEKTEIGELLKYAFEAGYKQGIEVKE